MKVKTLVRIVQTIDKVTIELEPDEARLLARFFTSLTDGEMADSMMLEINAPRVEQTSELINNICRAIRDKLDIRT